MAEAVPVILVRLIGIAEFAGASGLVIPMLTRIHPRLATLAAPGFVVLQACAIIFHISRGELQVLPFNFVLLAIAGFIFWGRSWKLPASSR